MTKLGIFLYERSISKALVSRKTGIGKNRLSELTNNPKTHLRVDELYLISKAINHDPCDLITLLCSDLHLVDSDKKTDNKAE